MAIHKTMAERVLEAIITMRNNQVYPQETTSDRDFPKETTPAVEEPVLAYMRDRGLVNFDLTDKAALTSTGISYYNSLLNTIQNGIIK